MNRAQISFNLVGNLYKNVDEVLSPVLLTDRIVEVFGYQLLNGSKHNASGDIITYLLGTIRVESVETAKVGMKAMNVKICVAFGGKLLETLDLDTVDEIIRSIVPAAYLSNCMIPILYGGVYYHFVNTEPPSSINYILLKRVGCSVC